MPSQAELAFQQFKARKEQAAKQSVQSVLERYGDAAQAPPEDLRALAQTEAYVEYDAAGGLVDARRAVRGGGLGGWVRGVDGVGQGLAGSAGCAVSAWLRKVIRHLPAALPASRGSVWTWTQASLRLGSTGSSGLGARQQRRWAPPDRGPLPHSLHS